VRSVTGVGVVVSGAALSRRFAAGGAGVVVNWLRGMSQLQQRLEELT
jgi:hypothetical protein